MRKMKLLLAGALIVGSFAGAPANADPPLDPIGGAICSYYLPGVPSLPVDACGLAYLYQSGDHLISAYVGAYHEGTWGDVEFRHEASPAYNYSETEVCLEGFTSDVAYQCAAFVQQGGETYVIADGTQVICLVTVETTKPLRYCHTL